MKEILQSIKRFITHRLFIFCVVTTVMFVLLINRLFTLQILQGEQLLADFTYKISKEREIAATRGNIYDRYGRPLAVNELAYSVTIDDSYDVEDKNKMIYDLITIIETNGDSITKDLPFTLDENSQLVYTVSETRVTRFKRDVFSRTELTQKQQEMNVQEMYEHMRDQLFKIDKDQYTMEDTLKIIAIRYSLYLKRFAKFRPEVIAVNINENTLAGIRENSGKFPGVAIIQDPLRVYPEGEYFAHIIGYTGAIQTDQLEALRLQDESYNANSIVGQIGIEREMEIYLKGTEGAEKVFVNNMGKTLEVTERIDPVPGKDIYLTIDKELQIEVYNALEKQLAQIIADRITPTGLENRAIVVDEVFIALINNNIINLRDIERSTESPLAQEVYNKYLSRKELFLGRIEQQLLGDQPLNTLDKELKSYLQYTFTSLEGKGVIKITSDQKAKDEIFDAYRKETISFSDFLRHAIDSNYLNLNLIGLSQSYYDYEEIYTVLVEYILRELDKDNEFTKRLYFNMIQNKVITNKEWSLLLFDLGILEYDEVVIDQLTRNRLSPIEFIKSKILNLEIKPSQMAIEPYQGSAVVVDVNTGEVLAMVSYPSYDNNRLVNSVDNNYFAQLINDQTVPMFHRALQQRTAPGSTFKMVSAMAGLTEGVIKPRETIRTEGIYTKIWPAVACWIYSSGGNHGTIDVIQALATSCNYFFNEVGFRLSLNESGRYVSATGTYILGQYAAMFGLDKKTGIELPEYTPQVSNQDAVRSAIGQGQHDYTPAQLARYVSTIANGGIVYELNIVDKIMNPDRTLFLEKTSQIDKVSYFNEEYLKIVREGMYNVTYGSRGTARSVFLGYPITVVGKSGTAEESKNSLNHSLFVGYAPYDNPQIGIAVTIPNGITGNNSARVLKEAVTSYFDLNKTYETLNYENILQ